MDKGSETSDHRRHLSTKSQQRLEVLLDNRTTSTTRTINYSAARFKALRTKLSNRTHTESKRYHRQYSIANWRYSNCHWWSDD